MSRRRSSSASRIDRGDNDNCIVASRRRRLHDDERNQHCFLRILNSMMNYSKQIKKRNFEGIFKSKQESSFLDDLTNASRHSKKAETGTINSGYPKGYRVFIRSQEANFRPRTNAAARAISHRGGAAPHG